MTGGSDKVATKEENSDEALSGRSHKCGEGEKLANPVITLDSCLQVEHDEVIMEK